MGCPKKKNGAQIGRPLLECVNPRLARERRFPTLGAISRAKKGYAQNAPDRKKYLQEEAPKRELDEKKDLTRLRGEERRRGKVGGEPWPLVRKSRPGTLGEKEPGSESAPAKTVGRENLADEVSQEQGAHKLYRGKGEPALQKEGFGAQEGCCGAGVNDGKQQCRQRLAAAPKG